MAKVDREALELVVEDLEKGAELNLKHVGDVFGSDFWELIVMLLLDAQDAARAIQGAINRLRDDAEVDDLEDDDDYEG
jgi:hypothetical protein